MKLHGLNVPEGAVVLEASGWKGTGNILLLVGEGSGRRVLKIYRRRRTAWREFWRGFSHAFIEGKSGVTACARCATERELSRLWNQQGFRAVRVLDQPMPEGLGAPALWLEYCGFDNLRDALARLDGSDALAARLGSALAARHRRAFDLREPRLIHEHGNVNHFFVDGDELVAFDLENAYRSDYDILDAIVQELAGVLRSLCDVVHGSDRLLRAFVGGYGDKDLLHEVCRRATGSATLRWLLWRRNEKSRRPEKSRLVVLERVQSMAGEEQA